MKTVSKSKLTLLTISLLFSLCTYSQVPIYNSYPSAAATVLLDFDGQYVDGTSWNWSGPLTLGPANVTTAQITEIFNRVAEDYRPFNVNITTDSTKYWAAPPTQRTRVILTITSDWYGAAGGVSYINSFTWGDNTPCFVFTALLGYNTKYIAEATSHEIGHTLGLNHQSSYDNNCNKLNEYNSGKGTGEIAWAPIMGVGYYRNFTLWHNGSNPWGCSSFQDDLSIITSKVGYRPDDYSGSINGTTTQLNFTNNRFSVDGVIEQITDKDVFKFIMPTRGLFHLDANPYNVGTGDNGSDLDVQLDLSTSSKKVLETYNPDLLLNATIDTTLDAGTYYLTIQSSGNIYAPDYASLGSYTLAAAYTPFTVLPVHRLQLEGKTVDAKHDLDWTIEADETVSHQVLESSTDGRNFTPLKDLNTSTRTYVNVPTDNTITYYRLNVTFDNNSQYFSNIIALPNVINKPTLTSNLVHNSAQVTSTTSFTYMLVDYSGRTVARGILSPGATTIQTSNLVNGMYIIQFSNGQQQYAEKFMKQ
ncbi:MAG: zinc-dependent metalloprotease [Flavisolibacter sp.]